MSPTCFAVRKGFRGRGLTYPLARATIDFARALEAYPMITKAGKEITWGELHVGARQVFADAGFAEITHPTRGGWSCASTSPGAGTDGAQPAVTWMYRGALGSLVLPRPSVAVAVMV